MYQDSDTAAEAPFGLKAGMYLFGAVASLWALFWTFIVLSGWLGPVLGFIATMVLATIPLTLVYWISLLVFGPLTRVTVTLTRGSRLGGVIFGTAGFLISLVLAGFLVASVVVYYTDDSANGEVAGKAPRDVGVSDETYNRQVERTLDLFTETKDGWTELDRKFAAQAAAIVHFTDLQQASRDMLPEIDTLVADMSRVETELFALIPPRSLRDSHDAVYGLSQQFRNVLVKFRRAMDAIVNGNPNWRDLSQDAGASLDEFNRDLARIRSDMLRPTE